MRRLSHPPCFDHPDNTRRRVQTMQLLIMQFSPTSCHFMLFLACVIWDIFYTLNFVENSLQRLVLIPSSTTKHTNFVSRSQLLFHTPRSYFVIRQHRASRIRVTASMSSFYKRGMILPTVACSYKTKCVRIQSSVVQVMTPCFRHVGCVNYQNTPVPKRHAMTTCSGRGGKYPHILSPATQNSSTVRPSLLFIRIL
jgi:hypothetical protein